MSRCVTRIGCRKTRLFWFALVIAALPAMGNAQPGMVAATPPMGWNSWHAFRCEIDEQLIRAAADAMVENGMKDAGYEYVVIDDCWQASRDEEGNILPDAEKFPSGMAALADYVHGKGLKLGLYSDAGTHTCKKRPGSHGYEEQDARQYAAWGVDYVKYDWCFAEGLDAREAYATMSKALEAAGRPMVFSICEWGGSEPWLWAPGVGNLWRTTGDIKDCWDCNESWGALGFIHVLDRQVGLHPFAGPGHWNDPDLLVFKGGMTTVEYRTWFSFWSLLAAPLMASFDLRDTPPEILEMVTNREVIAINQDRLGMQGRKVSDAGAVEVWMKPLAGAARAVILFNRGSARTPVRVSWEEIGLAPGSGANVRDLWTGKDLGVFKERFAAPVEPRGVVMVRIQP
jgi:alpha-galactosidase